MSQSKTKKLVIAAILVAVCIVIPLFMPIKLIIGPYTATLASHVPVILGTFISPLVGMVVALGSGIGFFIALGPIVGARAMSHMLFAGFMGYAFLKYSKDKILNVTVIGIIGAVIHAFCELGIVMLLTHVYKFDFIMAWTFFGTMAHHMIDLAIAYVVYKGLKRANVWDI